MLYPVRATMKLSRTTSYRNAILEAWNTFSSVRVEGSQQRTGNSEITNYYRIVFPNIITHGLPVAVPNMVTHGFPVIWQGHSYPVCSCPAYFYKSYTYTVGENQSTGFCKHIVEVLKVANIDLTQINWLSRPDNMPLTFKSIGLDEFQWI